jgi:hypothetical protein
MLCVIGENKTRWYCLYGLSAGRTVKAEHMFPLGMLKHGHKIHKQEQITGESPTSVVKKRLRTYPPCQVILQH